MALLAKNCSLLIFSPNSTFSMVFLLNWGKNLNFPPKKVNNLTIYDIENNIDVIVVVAPCEAKNFGQCPSLFNTCRGINKER